MHTLVTSLRNHAHRLPILHRSETARQFVKFGMVGVTNTVWDFGVYYALTRGWFGFSLHFLAANSIAFTISVLNSYLLNRTWTFRHNGRHHIAFTKFVIISLISLAAYEFLLFLFVDRIGFFDLYGKVISVAMVMVWNFSANKWWTFRAGRRIV